MIGSSNYIKCDPNFLKNEKFAIVNGNTIKYYSFKNTNPIELNYTFQGIQVVFSFGKNNVSYVGLVKDPDYILQFNNSSNIRTKTILAPENYIGYDDLDFYYAMIISLDQTRR